MKMAKKNPTKDDVSDLVDEGVEVEAPKEIERVGAVHAPQDLPRTNSKAQVGGIRPAPRQDNNRETPDLPPSENELVEIYCDEELHVNGKRLFGLIRVPRHQARSIIPMLQAKKRTDIEVYTGKNFLVKKGIDNRLIVTEVGEEALPGNKK
jgi:hypothetical protein